MHIKVYCLLMPLAFLLTMPASAAEDSGLALEANRDHLYLGESFILRVTVSGPGKDIEPDLSRIRNCRLELLGSKDISRSSITIANGRMVRDVFEGRVLSYRITPFESGLFQAGPVSLTVQGKTFAEQGPVVSVRDIAKQDMVKVSVSASRENPLVDEPFEIKLTILIRSLEGKYMSVQPLFPENPPNIDAGWLSGNPITGLESQDIRRILNDHLATRRDQAGIGINNITLRVDPFNFESLSSLGGFFSEPRRARYILNPRIIEVNGKSYVEYSLSVTFTPREEGDYVFGPVVFKGMIPAEVNDIGQARSAEIFAVGHACTVRVTPPPEEGRPASFSGAMGSNLVARASIDSQAFNVGDPMRLVLSVSGDARLDNMMPPKLNLQTNLQERFTIYDSTVESVREDQSSRRFVYTLRPTKSGACEFPPIEISFYDTGNRVYKTIKTDPVPLEIGKGREITGAGIIGRVEQAVQQKETPDLAGAVPKPIRASPSGAAPASLLGNPRMVGIVMVAGPLLYAVALLGLFVRTNRGSWQKDIQRRHAMPEVVARLRSAQSRCASNPAAARAEVCEAVRSYCSDRFQRSAAACTPDDIRKRLLDAGVGEELSREFSVAFGEASDASFSNAGGHRDLETIIAQLLQMMPRIERDVSGR